MRLIVVLDGVLLLLHGSEHIIVHPLFSLFVHNAQRVLCEGHVGIDQGLIVVFDFL